MYIYQLHEIQVADRNWEKMEMHILIVNIRHFKPKGLRDLIKFKTRIGSRSQIFVLFLTTIIIVHCKLRGELAKPWKLEIMELPKDWLFQVNIHIF